MTNENSEKSAVDIIYELYDLVKIQGEKIELLNKHLSVITNKVNGVLFPDPSLGLPRMQTKAASQPALVPPSVTIADPKTKPQPIKPRKNVKVFGVIEDNSGKKVVGAVVDINDANGTPVKHTKTNVQGLYVAHLPPGTYSAEFTVPGAKPEFRVFQVVEGQAELEII